MHLESSFYLGSELSDESPLVKNLSYIHNTPYAQYKPFNLLDHIQQFKRSHTFSQPSSFRQAVTDVIWMEHYSNILTIQEDITHYVSQKFSDKSDSLFTFKIIYKTHKRLYSILNKPTPQIRSIE